MKIPYFNPKYQLEAEGNLLQKSIDRVVQSGMFASADEVKNFEEEFANYCGAKHFIACANGTDAIELIFRSMEFIPGDEILVPAFSCWASVEPIILAGLKPVFVDISEKTFTLNPHLVQSAITPRTKAILTVNLYGNASDLEQLSEIATQNGLFLFEDCAQSHGVKLGGRMLGTFGEAAAFSFYPTKNLAALGEGGGVLTDNSALAEKLQLWRDHGQKSKDQHMFAGMNSRMDEIQAAILRSRLEHLNKWNEERRQVSVLYRKYLEGVVGIAEDILASNGHIFPILHPRRDKLKEYLKEMGIGTAVHYPYTLPGIVNDRDRGFPVARTLSRSVLSLPTWPGLKKSDVEYIAGCIIAFEG